MEREHAEKRAIWIAEMERRASEGTVVYTDEADGHRYYATRTIQSFGRPAIITVQEEEEPQLF